MFRNLVNEFDLNFKESKYFCKEFVNFENITPQTLSSKKYLKKKTLKKIPIVSEYEIFSILKFISCFLKAGNLSSFLFLIKRKKLLSS